MKDKITILYVDDEPINLMLFELNFEKLYTVITAGSGFLGLEKLSVNPAIKIVISDMKMPGMNGVEFIRKGKKEYPEIKFFILTGFEITEEIADALNEKIINKYFRKPFNMKEITNEIETVILK
jgi:two-component system response regulator (stage 0 sporulation protein F)